MNNEIKEILEMLRKYGSTNDKVLLDYITNLQQEKYELERDNKHLNGLLDTALNEQDRLQNENEILEQKLKDSIKFSEYRTKDWLDYKSRCEKAIEYVEKSKLNQLDTYCKYLYIDFTTEKIEHLDDLLNILQNGSDGQC